MLRNQGDLIDCLLCDMAYISHYGGAKYMRLVEIGTQFMII